MAPKVAHPEDIPPDLESVVEEMVAGMLAEADRLLSLHPAGRT